MAMPSSGVRKMTPRKNPQNMPPMVPTATRSTSCLVFGLFFPWGQDTIAASSTLIKCSFCKPWIRPRAFSAPSGSENLRTVTAATTLTPSVHSRPALTAGRLRYGISEIAATSPRAITEIAAGNPAASRIPWLETAANVPGLLGRDRQRDRERRAAVRIVRSRDRAAVAFDDGAADRQAHAQSLRLAGDEGIENRLELLRGDASAAVLDLDQHLRFIKRSRAHDQAPPAIESGSAHGAERIEHQVQDDLLKLDAVPLDRADVGRQVEVDRDLVQNRVAVHDALDDADHAVHVDVGQARRRAAALEHGVQPADDVAGARGDLADVLQRASHALKVGLGRTEQTHADMGVGEDGGEWLLQFVRQGCGQLTECGHARDVLQFGPLLRG